MMSARLLAHTNTQNRFAQFVTNTLDKLQLEYKHLLQKILAKRKWVALALFLIGALGAGLFHFIPAELAPAEDMGEIQIFMRAPRGSSFAYTDSYAKQMEQAINQIPDVQTYFTVSGGWGSTSHAFQIVQLKPKSERTISTGAAVANLTVAANNLAGVRTNVMPSMPPLAQFTGGDEGDNVSIVLMTTGDYQHLQKASQPFIEALKKLPQFTRVDNRLKWDSEEFKIDIDRNRAADLKVPISSIATTISTLMAGRQIGKADDAKVIVQMQQTDRENPNIFSEIYVRNMDNDVLPISQFSNISTISSPEVFHRYMRLHADNVYLTLANGIKTC